MYLHGVCVYNHLRYLQASIRLNSDGDFILHNEGRRPVYLGGRAVVSGKSAKLQHQQILEVLCIQCHMLCYSYRLCYIAGVPAEYWRYIIILYNIMFLNER